MRRKTCFLLLFFGLLSLKADQFAFFFYNDIFAGYDRHFTNGMGVSWIDEPTEGKESFTTKLHKGFASLPFKTVNNANNFNAGVSISQLMLTPEDISKPYPQYDDLPYAGYLYLSGYFFEWKSDFFYEYRVEVGVVGNESGAEFVQKQIHKIFDSEEPKGWHTQIGTKYTLNTMLRYGEISWQKELFGFLDMDWFNHAGCQLGNFETNVYGGTMFRIGYNYAKNFNVHYPYLKEEASLLKNSALQDGFGLSFSAGFNGELLAYSYVIEEAKNRGYRVDINHANYNIYTGVDLYYDRHKFVFFFQSQSPYTTQQSFFESFGGFSYIYHF